MGEAVGEDRLAYVRHCLVRHLAWIVLQQRCDGGDGDVPPVGADDLCSRHHLLHAIGMCSLPHLAMHQGDSRSLKSLELVSTYTRQSHDYGNVLAHRIDLHHSSPCSQLTFAHALTATERDSFQPF
jgi:hypothetical protein